MAHCRRSKRGTVASGRQARVWLAKQANRQQDTGDVLKPVRQQCTIGRQREANSRSTAVKRSPLTGQNDSQCLQSLLETKSLTVGNVDAARQEREEKAAFTEENNRNAKGSMKKNSDGDKALQGSFI